MTETTFPQEALDFEPLAREICATLDAKKAQKLLCLNVSNLTIIADYFVICSGHNAIQVKALYDAVEEKLEAQGVFMLRAEGYADGRWVVMDYGSILVHIFHEEDREFYHLERLWDDGNNRLVLELTED